MKMVCLFQSLILIIQLIILDYKEQGEGESDEGNYIHIFIYSCVTNRKKKSILAGSDVDAAGDDDESKDVGDDDEDDADEESRE